MRCQRCGAERLMTDMGFVSHPESGDPIPFCHPFDSTGVTCYMLASRSGAFGPVPE